MRRDVWDCAGRLGVRVTVRTMLLMYWPPTWWPTYGARSSRGELSFEKVDGAARSLIRLDLAVSFHGHDVEFASCTPRLCSRWCSMYSVVLSRARVTHAAWSKICGAPGTALDIVKNLKPVTLSIKKLRTDFEIVPKEQRNQKKQQIDAYVDA